MPERCYGKVQRSLALGKEVDEAIFPANYDNGLLEPHEADENASSSEIAQQCVERHLERHER
jgi:HSP20 family molecular chaperone IbpA